MTRYMFFVLCTMMEYLCHTWRGICSVCRNHNPVLSSFITDHRDCFIAPETFKLFGFPVFLFWASPDEGYSSVVHTTFDIHVFIVDRVTWRVTTRRARTNFLPFRSNSIFSVDHVAQSLVFCVVLCRSLFVLLSFFFWPLNCLSLDLRLLITPLVSSSLSYNTQDCEKKI